MDHYSLLREFADSWFLLLMFSFFLGLVVWVFRPGASSHQEEAAEIPFRHEDKPACEPAPAAFANDVKEARQ